MPEHLDRAGVPRPARKRPARPDRLHRPRPARPLPAIQPVTFVVANGEVVILTSAGSTLAAAARNAVVAFETDEFDSEAAKGWSVVVIGHARVIAADGELSRLQSLPMEPWTP